MSLDLASVSPNLSGCSLDVLLAQLSGYLQEQDIKQVKKAYNFAVLAHQSQYRKSGAPYITHPLAVAKILADIHMDYETIVSGLLHDVIEDTIYDKNYITQHFGPQVAAIVDGVSKISHINKQIPDKQKQAENVHKMLLAMTKDLRVIIVKLADRLHNLRTIDYLSAKKRIAVAKETMDIYVPIAQRLSMDEIRIELEDLSMAAAYPLRYQMIRKAVNKANADRKDQIHALKNKISEALAQAGIKAKIEGRQKHIASIYQKMRRQKKHTVDLYTDTYHKKTTHRSFYAIMDLYGLRIITDKIDDCYRTLGQVHNLYRPFPNRFKDYIAAPKMNGYQSLHTVVIGIKGNPVEIQIRTETMDAIANQGVAAHWLYKYQTKEKKDQNILPLTNSKTWTENILQLQEKTSNSLEFFKQIKLDFFSKEIFVFTPEHKIIHLPAEATPVDFAYAIHTDIGNRCIACEIDHQPATLSSKLQTGQIVKIITSPDSKPNFAWSTFVVTSKALSNITLNAKKSGHEDSLTLGKVLLHHALEYLGSHMDQIQASQRKQLLQKYQLQHVDELYQSIGLGNLMAFNVANSLMHTINSENPGKIKNPFAASVEQQKSQPVIYVGYHDNFVIHCAGCCHPIPGDEILAVPSLGKGIVIHRTNCSNIREIKNDPEKSISAKWDQHLHGHMLHKEHQQADKEFIASIQVQVPDQRNIIAQLVHQINQSHADIENISIEERNARLNSIKLSILVKNRVHLAQVIRNIRKIAGIQNIVRR